MNAFILFILKSSVCFTLFYIFFKFLLSSETFYKVNRAVVLCIYVLAILIPSLKLTIDPLGMQDCVAGIDNLLGRTNGTGVNQVRVLSGWSVLFGIYILGVVFLIARNLFSFISLWRLLRQGRAERRYDGCKLIVHQQADAPFSFLGRVVVSETDLDEHGDIILIHEAAHVKYYHHIDLFLSELFLVFNWFNPFAWLMKKELQRIHEYQADERVLSKGIDAREYQLLLVRRMVGEQRFRALTCGFEHGKLKSRIMMMLRKKSNPLDMLKCFYMLPLVVVCMLLFSCSHDGETVLRMNDEVSFLPIVMGGTEFTVKKSVVMDLNGRKIPVILELGSK